MRTSQKTEENVKPRGKRGGKHLQLSKCVGVEERKVKIITLTFSSCSSESKAHFPV